MPIGNDDKGVWLECVKEYETGRAILDPKNGFVRTLLSWDRPPSFVFVPGADDRGLWSDMLAFLWC